MGVFNASYVVGGRFDTPFMPTKKFPYTKGIRIEMSGFDPEVVNNYTVTQDSELLSIALAASRYFDKDYWNFYVNNKLVMDEIYTKDLPEGKYLMVVIPLKQGDILKFEYRNASSTSKAIWIDYQMLV